MQPIEHLDSLDLDTLVKLAALTRPQTIEPKEILEPATNLSELVAYIRAHGEFPVGTVVFKWRPETLAETAARREDELHQRMFL